MKMVSILNLGLRKGENEMSVQLETCFHAGQLLGVLSTGSGLSEEVLEKVPLPEAEKDTA